MTMTDTETHDINITISNRTDIRQGYRVRCFSLPRHNWNALSYTLAERTGIRTEQEARKLAADWQRQYGGEILD